MRIKRCIILFLFICLLSTVALSRAETDVNGWLANIYIKEQRDADFEQWTAGYKCSILRYMKEVGVEVGDVPHPEDEDTPYVAFTENSEESKHYLVSFGTETKTFVIVTIDALSGVGLTFCISSK